MTHRPLVKCSLVLLVALLAGGPPAHAQTPAPDSTAGDAELLGPPFKDENSGFIICPPAHARIVTRNGLDLVNFLDEGRQFGASVRISLLDDPIAPDELLKATADDVSKRFKGVQILESKPLVFDGKPAGRFVASMVADDGKKQIAILRQQLLVRTGDKEYFVFSFLSPLSAQAEASALFDAMARSFKVLDRKAIKESRRQAIQAGKAWLRHVNAAKLIPHLVPENRVLEVQVGNRDYGYITVGEKPDRKDGYAGLSVITDSNTFPNGQSVLISHNEAFWADERGPDPAAGKIVYSVWNHSSEAKTKINPTITRTSNSTETGVQQAKPDGNFYITVVATTWIYSDGSAPMMPKTNPKEWKVDPEGPAVLPATLEWLWPRAVDLHKPTRMAFVAYNANQERLGLRTLAVIGPETITIGDQTVNAIHVSDELDPGTTDMWVDDDGKLLLMKTSDGTTLTPTSIEKMNTFWARRLK